MENYYKSKDDIFVSTQLLRSVFSKLPRSNSINGESDLIFPICNKVYHYTTTAVLDKVLENGKFRATNVYYLNDTGEMHFGIKKIGKMSNVSENQKINLVPYTISFSCENDLLNQWVCYGKESGVSIGFDFPENNGKQDTFCLNVGGINLSSTWCYPRLMYYLPKDSSVKDEKLRIEVKKFLENIKSVLQLQDKNSEGHEKMAEEITVELLATYLKRDEFNGEKEARIVVFPLSDFESFDDRKSEISFFCNSKGILKPYVDVECILRKNSGWPISSITVGPSGNQDAVFKSIIMRLEYGKCHLYPFNDIQKRDHKREYCDAFIEKYREKYNNGEELTIDLEKKIRDIIINNKNYDVNLSNITAFNINDIKENECYYCEKSSIFVKKSKIPYLFT